MAEEKQLKEIERNKIDTERKTKQKQDELQEQKE
jgi:hypothetical protein